MADVKLEEGDFESDFILRNLETNQVIKIQSEDEYCSAARYFGWSACKKCDMTDGSVDCKHHKIKEMISDAKKWLEAKIGEITDDPGWFEWYEQE
jgi:hypothetical protein